MKIYRIAKAMLPMFEIDYLVCQSQEYIDALETVALDSKEWAEEIKNEEQGQLHKDSVPIKYEFIFNKIDISSNFKQLCKYLNVLEEHVPSKAYAYHILSVEIFSDNDAPRNNVNSGKGSGGIELIFPLEEEYTEKYAYLNILTVIKANASELAKGLIENDYIKVYLDGSIVHEIQHGLQQAVIGDLKGVFRPPYIRPPKLKEFDLLDDNQKDQWEKYYGQPTEIQAKATEVAVSYLGAIKSSWRKSCITNPTKLSELIKMVQSPINQKFIQSFVYFYDKSFNGEMLKDKNIRKKVLQHSLRNYNKLRKQFLEDLLRDGIEALKI